MQLVLICFAINTISFALATCVLLSYIPYFGNSIVSDSLKALMLVFRLGFFQIF